MTRFEGSHLSGAWWEGGLNHSSGGNAAGRACSCNSGNADCCCDKGRKVVDVSSKCTKTAIIATELAESPIIEFLRYLLRPILARFY